MTSAVPKLPHWPPRAPGWWGRWHRLRLIRFALLLLLSGALTSLIFLHQDYYQIESRLERLQVNRPAPRNLIARSRTTWLDLEATRQRREEAARRVPPVYRYDEDALIIARGELTEIFDLLRLTNGPPSPATPPSEAPPGLAPYDLPTHALVTARAVTPDDLTRLHQMAEEMLTTVMLRSRIDEEGVAAAQRRLVGMTSLRIADPARAHLLAAILTDVVRPTWVRDDEATEALRQYAREQARPVTRHYRRGQVLLRKGEIITSEAWRQLREQHLLLPAPLVRIAPLAALTLLWGLLLGLFLRAYCPDVYASPRRLILLVCLLVAAEWATMSLGGQQQEVLVGLVALPAGSMAIAGLLGTPLAIVAALFLAVSASLSAQLPLAMLLAILGSALTAVAVVGVIWPASRAIPAVLALVGVNFALLICLECLHPGDGTMSLWAEIDRLALWASAGGIGATFIAVGAIYLLARPFGITTHYRLMELANSNEPLLRRLMNEAPGTYHSSEMVANIAEPAAAAIGANPLLTRVAALHHDIGKLKRPAFFVENQAPLGIDNIHQRLSPKLSFLILTSHVRDGLTIGRQYQLPEEVLTIIGEHHGTTLAAYFYHRAVTEANGTLIPEHEFRYPGPKPSTREAAVVMLADSVQASVKALKEPTPSRIESMVHEIIAHRLADGQFEDCPISLRDLRRISEVLTRILTGLYTYSRIEYPDLKGTGGRIRANLHSRTSDAPVEPTVASPSS
jgi:putative nucleotidyltransferase with HDIG domain